MRRVVLLGLGGLMACGREPARAVADASADTTASAPIVRGSVIVRDSTHLVFVACGTTVERSVTERRFAKLIAAVTAVNGALKDSAFVELEADTVQGKIDVHETRFATSLAEGTPCDRPREPFDFVAMGNEPFWRITVEGRELVLERPEPPLELAFALDSSRVTAGLHTFAASRSAPPMPARYRGPPPDTTLVLSLVRADCRDGMSDAWYPYRAEVRLGKRAWHGCARR